MDGDNESWDKIERGHESSSASSSTFAAAAAGTSKNTNEEKCGTPPTTPSPVPSLNGLHEFQNNSLTVGSKLLGHNYNGTGKSLPIITATT